MSPYRQQVCCIATAFGVLLFTGCEGAPARSKPWRHAKESASLTRDGAEAASGSLAKSTDEVAREKTRPDPDVLRVWLDAEPGNLNPLYPGSLWALRIRSWTVFESLFDYRQLRPKDSFGTLVPLLAESVQVLNGGTRYRIRLREGVMFHSGAPLSSVDVQYSLDLFRSKRSPRPELRDALSDLRRVDLRGPLSLELELARENGFVMRTLALVPVLSKGASKSQVPAGTGPYLLKSGERQSIRLERFGNYWGRPSAFRRIEFWRERDGAEALLGAKEGLYDVLALIRQVHYPEQLDRPGVQSNFDVQRLVLPNFRYAAVNCKQGAFANPELRRAFSLLVDRSALVEAVGGANVQPTANIVWTGGPGNGSSPQMPIFDPKLASELLQRVGYMREGDNGVRKKAGQPLNVLVLATNEERPERRLVLEQLRKAGFELDIRVGTPAVLLNRMVSGSFDLAFVDWSGASDVDLSALLGASGSKNWGGCSSARMESILSKLNKAKNAQDRLRHWTSLSEEFATLLPIIPMLRMAPVSIARKSKHAAAPWQGWWRFSKRAESTRP